MGAGETRVVDDGTDWDALDAFALAEESDELETLALGGGLDVSDLGSGKVGEEGGKEAEADGRLADVGLVAGYKEADARFGREGGRRRSERRRGGGGRGGGLLQLGLCEDDRRERAAKDNIACIHLYIHRGSAQKPHEVAIPNNAGSRKGRRELVS